MALDNISKQIAEALKVTSRRARRSTDQGDDFWLNEADEFIARLSGLVVFVEKGSYDRLIVATREKTFFSKE